MRALDPHPNDQIRVAHIVSHPIQYFAPLYRELAKRSEIDVTVFYYSDATLREFRDPDLGVLKWDIDLVGGYNSQILPSAQRRPVTASSARPNMDVLAAILRGRFDVVWAHGYAFTNTWFAYAITKLTRKSFLLREEAGLQYPRKRWRAAMKALPLQLLMRGSYGLYTGVENKAYMQHYGMAASRLFPAPYCVDNEVFQSQAQALLPQRDAVRREFGVTDSHPVVLFAGKLIAKKQPLAVLHAFQEIREDFPCWLLMAGDGPLASQVDQFIRDQKISNVIRTGTLPQRAISKAYAASDLFVLFSEGFETWGLVVNEAMNFRLPLIVSDKVGCASDLVTGRGTGMVVPSEDVGALAKQMKALISDPQRRAQMGKASRDVVDRYSISVCADGIVTACLAAGRSGTAERARKLP